MTAVPGEATRNRPVSHPTAPSCRSRDGGVCARAAAALFSGSPIVGLIMAEQEAVLFLFFFFQLAGTEVSSLELGKSLQ